MPEQSEEQIFRDIEESGKKKTAKPGIEIAKGSEGLKEVEQSFGDLKRALEHDEPVTLEQLSRLERDLDNLVVDIGGTRMTLKEFREIPDLKKNVEIWKKIKQGDFSRTNLLTFLSDQAVESLSKHRGNLSLRSLTFLSDQAAESLGKHEGDLILSGLTILSDQAAESLSKQEGWLYLCGLTTLSDQAAESLSKHEGDLYLSGLTTLSDQAAESLSRNKGRLDLKSLTTLSDQAAESLSRHKGSYLDLFGLTTLSDQAAKSLAGHSKLFISRKIQSQINRFKK